MLRGLISLLFLCGLALLAAPFLVSSLYIDERGITIPGRVYSKSEIVLVHYSGWQRRTEVTIEYSPPETAGVTFFGARLDPQQYDALHAGQSVSLHYLRREDVP